MIKVKTTVRPRSLLILAAAANAIAPFDVDLVVTSGHDGKHMQGSKHYEGNALDLRSRTFPTQAAKRAFVAALRARLGADYQVLLEHEGVTNEHVHVEYDPPG